MGHFIKQWEGFAQKVTFDTEREKQKLCSM